MLNSDFIGKQNFYLSRGDIMNKIEELKLLIEEIETKLTAYLNNGRSPEEICELSKELDKLIIKHCNLPK